MRELTNIPNLLSVSRIGLTGVFLYCFLSPGWELKALATGVFIIASVTDYTDGYFARKRNAVTAFGAFLDPLADKILTIAVMMALVVAGLVEWWIVAVIMVRDAAVTGLRIYASSRDRQMQTTTLAKWKTASQLVAITAILILWSAQTVSINMFGVSLMTETNLRLLFNCVIGISMILAVISGVRYFAAGEGRYTSEFG